MEMLLLMGFALGLKHSTDADHLAAVSALTSRSSNGGSHFSSARTGALWGAGHLLAVLLAGGALIVWRVNLPAAAAWALELLVACILIWLGVRTIQNALRGRLHFHFHRHGAGPHAHVHFHAATQSHDEHAHNEQAHNAHLPAPRSGRSAFFLGTLHGLVGTAGLTLLVLATIPSRSIALLYLLMFGAGALLGMTVFSATLSVVLRGGARWLVIARLAAGVANTLIGCALTHRILSSI